MVYLTALHKTREYELAHIFLPKNNDLINKIHQLIELE